MKNSPQKVGTLNTWYEEIPGFLTLQGNIMLKPAVIGVHFTSDDHESLSLEAGGVQITVNFANLKEIIRTARKNNEQRKNSRYSN